MPSPSPSPIALLTDFGSLDPYVGIMKAVIAGIAPGAMLIDISHQIPPGDIRRSAFVLWQALPFLPDGAVCLCVIDPGVGTARKPVCFEGERVRVIAPDNGLLTYVLGTNPAVYELADLQYRLPQPSITFHGRDIFAPAAAHAALGVPAEAFGPLVPEPVRFRLPALDFSSDGVAGQTLHADRFGNVLTSLGRIGRTGQDFLIESWLPPTKNQHFHRGMQVHFRGMRLALVDTFADIPPGEVAGIIGSTGLLEIAANGANAQHLLDISPGEPVELRRIDG
jgi:S-adenosylmethionine hydrolase